MTATSSASSSDEMRIVFVHSGKGYFKTLGPHYSNLIKNTLSLLSINQYLRLGALDKDKFRAIEALPSGAIVGVALIDKSFWLNANQLNNNPWAHGPYCYHIIDALRLKKPIECRGLPGIWNMDKQTRTAIESMPYVNSKIIEWKNRYNISNKTDSCLTVMQPFAEAIVRKIKTVENRGARLFIMSSNDGQFEGCRICLDKNNVHNYGQTQVVDNKKWNKNIPKYTKHTNFKYHQTATLTQCQCKKGKSKKRMQKDTKVQKRNKTKKKKPILKPLPNYNAMTKRRKPSKKRNAGDTKIKYGKYYDSEFIADCGKFDKDKTYNFRHKDSDCYNRLLEMGYSQDLVRRATTRRYTNVDDCIRYLCKLQRVEESRDTKLGYSDSLNMKHINKERRNRKRKREEMIEVDSEDIDDVLDDNHNHKYNEYKEILDNDYDESMAIEQAIKESKSTYSNESKSEIMNEKNKNGMRRKDDVRVMCNNNTKENLQANGRRQTFKRRKLYNGLLRTRCD